MASVNSRPFVLGVASVIYLVSAYFVIQAFISGDGFDRMKIAAFFGAAGVLIFGAMRQWWVALLLGALSFWSSVVMPPFPILRSMGPYMAVSLLIIGFLLLDIAIRKTKVVVVWRRPYTLLLLCAAIIFARIAYDRPGLASLGADTGGIGAAVNAFTAMLSLFAAYWATAYVKNWDRTFVAAGILSIFGFILIEIIFYRLLPGDFSSMYAISFNRCLYLPFAMLVVWSLSKKASALYGNAAYVFSFLLLLGLATISMVRSSIFQAAAMCLGAAFIFRKTATGVLVVVVGGTLVVSSLLTLFDFKDLPNFVQRPLSIFITGEQMSADYGMKDEWRAALRRSAYRKIQANPFFGDGWRFDVDEMLNIMAEVGADVEDSYLAEGGSYHNTFLMLAVKNGAPVSIIYFFIVVSLGVSLSRWTMTQPAGSQEKTSVAILLVYAASIFVMFFANGSMFEVFAMNIVLGIACGIRDRTDLANKKAESAEIPLPFEPLDISSTKRRKFARM